MTWQKGHGSPTGHTPLHNAPASIVVGAGGLLGSSISAELGRTGLLGPAAKGLDWNRQTVLGRQFRDLISDLRRTVGKEGSWAVYWCAGVGVVSSSEAVHRSDQVALGLLLNALRDGAPAGRGVIAYASSAGGVYSGNNSFPVSEVTDAIPAHEYGRSKLRQEAMIVNAISSSSNVCAVSLRFANLYGVGQSITKPQGLISHLVANTFFRRPSMVYVPMDTSRDYLFTTDAAAMAIRAVGRTFSEPVGRSRLQLVASEENHTISQLIAILSRIMRRRVPVVERTMLDGNRQPPLLSFRSIDSDQRHLSNVSMTEGMARIVAEYAHVIANTPASYR